MRNFKNIVNTTAIAIVCLVLNIFWIIKDIQTYICIGCVAWMPTVMFIKSIIEDIRYYKSQEED
jgi:hypothetical protein